MASLHLRLPVDLDDYLTRSARQTRRSKNDVAAQMLEEARRVRQFPGIAYRGTDWERRPWLVGSGMDVWEAMMLLRDWDDHDALLRDTALREQDVALARAYAERYPAEIAEALAENDADLDAIAAAHPTFKVLRLDD
jgi:hypothetical protein